MIIGLYPCRTFIKSVSILVFILLICLKFKLKIYSNSFIVAMAMCRASYLFCAFYVHVEKACFIAVIIVVLSHSLIIFISENPSAFSNLIKFAVVIGVS